MLLRLLPQISNKQSSINNSQLPLFPVPCLLSPWNSAVMRHSFFVAVLFAVLLAAGPLHGAAPKVDWVFPAGVGPASMTTVTLSDGAGWPVRVWIDQPEGITIEAAKEKGRLVITTAADVKPGVRWLRLYNAEGASAPRPLIIGSLPQLLEAEPNNTVDQAQKVPDRITIQGRLEKNGEVDGFRVSLKAGQVFIASLIANEILGSPMDGVLQLCDGEGHIITQSDDEVGLDPRIVHEVKRDGDYIVRCFAFPATPNSTINFAGGNDYIYQLTLTTGPFADHAFPLGATRDATTSFTLAGWNLTPQTRTLSLSPQAAAYATLHHPALANTLSIPLTDHASLIAQPSKKSKKSEESKAQIITPPCIITGRLGEASHQAAFRFTARKGERLRLKVESQTLGFPLDPVLTLRDATGKVITETDDTGKARDPSHLFSPPADGEYEVMVRDLHHRGGFRFVYRLTVEPVVADVALTLAGDSFVAAAGKPVEIPVAIDRRDGFAEELTITLEGLPAGVTVSPVISKPKNASEKSVKLIIPAGAAAWSGPVRVIAKTAGLQRIAGFTTINEARHETAWLTIRAAGK